MDQKNHINAVPYIDLIGQGAEEHDDIIACVETVLSNGQYVGGDLIEQFENEAANYCGVKHAVGVASGTAALILALQALDIGPGDDVITVANSFITSTSAIMMVGARPVFVDVGPDQLIDVALVEDAITERTKGILPVHLTGRVCDMPSLMEIAERRGLYVIEDAAQAIGSKFDNRHAGSFGDIGCFSAHPLKNLNAMGDAGFITTNHADIAERVKRLRNAGLKDRDTVTEWAGVARLDTLQAAVLSMRLAKLDKIIAKRRANAAVYDELLADTPIFIPPASAREFNSYHTFVIQADDRDGLQRFLAARGVGSAIHYPIPIHLQPVAKGLGYEQGTLPETEHQSGRILSIPIHQYLSEEEIGRVSAEVSNYSTVAAKF